MSTRGRYDNRWLPLAIAAPQLTIVFLFFYWPTLKALWWSFTLERPFGGGSTFVGLYNFLELFADDEFVNSLERSFVFAFATTGLAIAIATVLAVAADRRIRARRLFGQVLVWPYAIAAPIAGVIFNFILQPTIGIVSLLGTGEPNFWQPSADGTQAMIMIILASAWGLIPLFFIVLMAGFQAIPDAYLEAAAVDGAGPWRRLWQIQIPLLTPHLFFAFVLGLVESFSGAFGIVHTMTQGGPDGATNLLVYKIYADGFVGLDLSAASAQSVLLMGLVIALTAASFRLIERNINYQR